LSALTPRPLTAGAFAPFGDLLSFDPAKARLVNDSNALRSDLPARLSFSAGKPNLALYRVEAQRLPLTIAVMEHHPNSSQAFIPVSAERFLVVVAPTAPDGSPDIWRCEAFVGQRGQGFNYYPGVWHAPIIALDAGGDFLMLIWEQGAAEDCRIERLSPPIQVVSDPR
jgi:ureidoglycolate lyase